MIRILLADDHEVVREGIRALLESQPDFRVVGEAGSGTETIRAVERLQADVLLLDLMMPSLSGLEVVKQVAGRRDGPRVVVLSMYDNEAYVAETLRDGACGYVLKSAATDEVVTAVREAAAGRRYLGPEISEVAVAAYERSARGGSEDPYDSLTRREREVFQLVAEGNTNAQIGELLFISPRTVETHRANLMRKLRLDNQADVVREAIERGLIRVERRG